MEHMMFPLPQPGACTICGGEWRGDGEAGDCWIEGSVGGKPRLLEVCRLCNGERAVANLVQRALDAIAGSEDK